MTRSRRKLEAGAHIKDSGVLREANSQPRILPYLPLEVSQEIASYLTVESGLCLMRTCKALSLIGEIKVYEMLDLTGSWSDEAHLSSFTQ